MEELLTTRAAAGILKMSHRTLESFRLRGGGPRYVRLSRRAVRYHPADLDAWIEESRRSSTSDAGQNQGGPRGGRQAETGAPTSTSDGSASER
jgi:predicted DNA-binding transcriptional regulator AlpA